MSNKFSLDSVITEHTVKPPFMTIHGDPGVGKTYFATRIPDHILIRTEDGLGSLQASAFPKCNSFTDVIDQLRVLIDEDHAYSTAVIDTASAFETLLHEQAVADWNADGTLDPKHINLISDPGWGAGPRFARSHWNYFIKLIDELQEKKNMAVVLLAHSEEKSRVDPLSSTYKKVSLRLGNIPSDILIEKCDLIAHMRVTTNISKEKKDFGGHNVRASTSGSRILCVDVHPSYEAKNRYGLKGDINATWADLMAAIQKAADTN